MLHKCISGVLFQITLLLLCVSVGAVSLDDVSFQPSTAPQPPLTLLEATIDSEGELLSHDHVYQVHVQVKNTRPHGVDGVVELAAFSLSESAVTLGHETVNLDPDGSTSLLFTFSPNDVTLPCTDYIFMVTTEPGSSAHISERDYIFVDERREFAFADCAENIGSNESISDTSVGTDETLSQTIPQNQMTQPMFTIQKTQKPMNQPTQKPTTQATQPMFTIQTTQEPIIQATQTPTTQPMQEPTIQAAQTPATQPTQEPLIQTTQTPATQPTQEPIIQATQTPTIQPMQEYLVSNNAE